MSVMEFVLDGNQGVQGQKRENDKHYYYDYYQRKFGCETSELRTFKNAQSNRFVK